jgi:hypothetical protein
MIIEKIISYSWLEKKNIVHSFKCTTCQNNTCYRPQDQHELTFLEGFYLCSKCEKEVVYYDDDFTRFESEVRPTQLQLF